MNLLHKTAVFLLLSILFLGGCNNSSASQPIRVGVLISGDIRMEPLEGLIDGMTELGYIEGETIVYEIRNANGNRDQLTELAVEIVESQPHIAIAGGGIEADALFSATAETDIPVVFLSVSSAVSRGIVDSLRSSGNNFTGIETNDADLTAKRMELITRMWPDAKDIFILHMPSITPSVESIAVARQFAPSFGVTLTVREVETTEDIQAAVNELSTLQPDAVLLLPVAPINQSIEPIIYPAALAAGIPIMGYGRSGLEEGVVASYAGSRYQNGIQAARLVDKILRGTPPANIPIETPYQFEFVINQSTVDKLGITISDEAWGLADEIVTIEVNP